jgi:hypothetical protein
VEEKASVICAAMLNAPAIAPSRSLHWLLAYEANIKKWLPNSGGTDYVRKDVNFGFLKRNKVSFYDSSLAAPLTPGRKRRRILPLPTLPTISLIELTQY